MVSVEVNVMNGDLRDVIRDGLDRMTKQKGLTRRWLTPFMYWLPVCNPLHNRSLSPAVNRKPSISKSYQGA